MSDLQERLSFYMGNKEIRALLGEIPGVTVSEVVNYKNFYPRYPTVKAALDTCRTKLRPRNEAILAREYSEEWARQCLEPLKLSGDGYLCCQTKSDTLYAKVTLADPLNNLMTLLKVNKFIYFDIQNRLLFYFSHWELEKEFYMRNF
jgi:hypothetical protein